MSTADQLHAAVIANPDEDTPRLIFADFLEENDQPERAEFIRLQCEAARLPDWDARVGRIRHRVRSLLARHSRAWRAELPKLPGVEWGRFHRGFVSTVLLTSAHSLLEHEGAIRAAAPVEGVEFLDSSFASAGRPMRFPWVRMIRLHDRHEFAAGQFEELLNSGIAENLLVLDLSGVGAENAGARVVAAAKHLTKLEVLDLSDCFVGVEGAAALTAADHLANLRVVRFSSYGSGYVEDPFLNTEGVEVLTAPESRLKNLRTLELGQNSLTDAAVRTLLTSPNLANLEELNLRWCDLDDGAFAVPVGPTRLKSLDISGVNLDAVSIRALAELPQFGSLVRLRADGCGLGRDSVATLAKAGFVRELRELYLSDCNLQTGGATALAGGDWHDLHTLDLRRNKITSAGVHDLALGTFPALADLRLDDNEIGDAGAKTLASASWAGSLRRLRLTQTKMGAEGATALAVSPRLRNLTQLDLAGSAIGPEGAVAIARAPWAGLTDLGLGSAKVGDAGVRAIAAAGFVPNLVSLVLDNNDLTADSARVLAAVEWNSLRELTLGTNKKLGAAGALALAESTGFPVLLSLGLSYCDLDVAAMEAFAGSELAARLRRFNTHGNKPAPDLQKRLYPLNWGDRGPDWVEEDTTPEDEW